MPRRKMSKLVSADSQCVVGRERMGIAMADDACGEDYPDLYSNRNERDAVNAINTNNRVGGPGIFGGTSAEEIQAQNLKLKEELEAIRATLAANNLKVAATDTDATSPKVAA